MFQFFFALAMRILVIEIGRVKDNLESPHTRLPLFAVGGVSKSFVIGETGP
jgi:hypothetical protein